MQDDTQSAQVGVDEEATGFFDRATDQLGALVDSSRQSLDLKAQLAELQQLVESSVEEMVNLIVIFLLQTPAHSNRHAVAVDTCYQRNLAPDQRAQLIFWQRPTEARNPRWAACAGPRYPRSRCEPRRVLHAR